MFRNNRVSLRVKLIIFIVFFVCVSVVSTVCITYQLNRKLIEDNFGVTAYNSASSFAVFLDADFLKELRELVESEEYQQLRALAEVRWHHVFNVLIHFCIWAFFLGVFYENCFTRY